MISKILKNKQAVIGLTMILIVVFLAIFSPLLSPNDPMKGNIIDKFETNTDDYPLGTDQLGRCICSRLIYGARYSLGIAIPSLLIIMTISIILGTVTAYYGGIIDRIFLSICDIVMAFPPLVIVLALVASLGQGILNLMFAIIFGMWVWYTKMVRSYVLTEKNKEYISAARINGSSDIKIIFKHIIPNIFPCMVVLFSLGVGDVIIMISGFSFLGLGMEASIPEWGSMLNLSKKYFYSRPELMFYPGFCIFFTVVGFNIFGEGLRDIISN